MPLLLAWVFTSATPALTPAALSLRKHKYPPDISEIVSRMTEAGKRLKSLSANLEYTKVTVLVNDKSTESGQIFFHESKNREILIKIQKPDPKVILFRKNKAEIYMPKINEIQEYDLGQSTGLVEQFFLLGFGKRTEDLKKHYDLKFVNEEDIDGDTTVVLELAPRKESISAHITKVLLWISEESWIPVQQKFFEPGGDHMVARYTRVRVNRYIPPSIFNLNASEGVKRVKIN